MFWGKTLYSLISKYTCQTVTGKPVVICSYLILFYLNYSYEIIFFFFFFFVVDYDTLLELNAKAAEEMRAKEEEEDEQLVQ